MGDMSCRISRDFNSDGVRIIFRQKDGLRRYLMTYKGDWVEVPYDVELPPEVSWRVPGDYDLLQKLADALYEFGVIPHGYIPQRGEIEATEKHLEDMRALVSKFTKAELPKGKVEMKHF